MGKRTGRLHRLNLQQRMTLWSAGIILGLLACVFASLHLLVTSQMHAQVESNLVSTRRVFDALYKARGEDLLHQCVLFAKLPRLSHAVLGASAPEVSRLVCDYAELLGADYALVTDREGHALAKWKKDPKAPDVSLDEVVTGALDVGEQSRTIVVGDTMLQVGACAIYRSAKPDPDREKPIGALATARPIDSHFVSGLSMTMSAGDEGGGAPGPPITIFSGFSARGVLPSVVASSLTDDRDYPEKKLLDALRRLSRDPLRPSSERQSNAYVLDMGSGQRYLTVTAPLQGGTRKPVAPFIIQRPLDQALKPVADMQKSLFFVGIFAVMAAVAASYIVANGVGRHVLKVVRAAEALSAGDWSQRVPVEGPDDLRGLAEGFNRMASRLQGWDAELRAEVALRTEELNQAMARLDANLRQMRQFHADASHELRTPLTIMRGEVEVALRTLRTPEEYQRVLRSILEEMNRVSAIVGHLLLLARADSGQVQLARETVSLNELMQDLHEQGLLLARPKGLEVHLDAEEEVTVAGDSGKLRQLFLNLVDNAVKYTPEKGSVWLRVFRDNGFAAVSVRDTGIGIAQTDIPHIFDRFFRADRARSREMGGAGLGLAICQWIIDAHHGWIDVQSAVGQGTTFTVYIPRTASETTPGPADPPLAIASAAGAGGGEH